MADSQRTDESRRPPTEIDDLVAAIQEFEVALPGWWWSVCTCNLTRDASCGPDFRDARCSDEDIAKFDEGFHCDGEGSLADALRDVMRQAQEAKEPYVVTAVNKDGKLAAAEFIEGLDPDQLIEAIGLWTGQGCEFRIKRVADA